MAGAFARPAMRTGAAALQPAHPLCRIMAPLHPSPPPTPENNPADYRCRRFDVALYVSWAHLIELLGHTEMTWTPVGHWMRAIPDLLGLSLQVRQRGPNHRTPLPHRCSASILPSGLLPHSCGRRAFTPQLLRNCGAHGTGVDSSLPRCTGSAPHHAPPEAPLQLLKAAHPIRPSLRHLRTTAQQERRLEACR